MELAPSVKDSGMKIRKEVLCYQLCRTGEQLALEQLEAFTKIPGSHTYGNLRLNPMWDPLRGDPRFEKIVASLAPKDTVYQSSRSVIRWVSIQLACSSFSPP